MASALLLTFSFAAFVLSFPFAAFLLAFHSVNIHQDRLVLVVILDDYISSLATLAYSSATRSRPRSCSNTVLSGNGLNADYDQECFTRANVAYSRATNLTMLASPLNMQGMPGALQALAALLHGVQTVHTNDARKLTACGSLNLEAVQVSEATAAFQVALLPHDLWFGSLPVCLAEYHEGKVRRLRLVLATKSHLLTAEASCLQDGPHLPGHTAKHGLLFGYALDAVQTPEWLVVPEGQQSGQWRLLHNSTDSGRRCSVGCSKRYQPRSGAEPSRKGQDYSFEAVHRIYFYNAWRPEPVLDTPGSELVLPPEAGRLVHGCYWPRQQNSDEVHTVSDVETEAAENPHPPPPSPAATDATMASGEGNSIVGAFWIEISRIPVWLQAAV